MNNNFINKCFYYSNYGGLRMDCIIINENK